MLPAQVLDLIKNQLIQRIPGLIGIYQFGSSVGASARLETTESDLDLAVLGPQPIPPETLFELKGILEPIAGRDVDLIDLRSADSVITHQVLESGICIYQSDSKALALFEVTAMSKYCNLNEERKEILAEVKKKGRIHAR